MEMYGHDSLHQATRVNLSIYLRFEGDFIRARGEWFTDGVASVKAGVNKILIYSNDTCDEVGAEADASEDTKSVKAQSSWNTLFQEADLPPARDLLVETSFIVESTVDFKHREWCL